MTMTIRAGDKFWFPPSDEGGELEGILMTVMKVDNVHPYGEVIFWTDGTWTKVQELTGAFKITEEFIRDLWVRAGE